MRNKLDRMQFFKVCEFIQNDKARFLEEKPKLTKTAVEATRTLGFTVVPPQIADAQKATGIEWRNSGSGGGSTFHRDKRLNIVVDAVIHLYKACGESLPKEFSEMIERRRKQAEEEERTPTHGKVDVPIVSNGKK